MCGLAHAASKRLGTGCHRLTFVHRGRVVLRINRAGELVGVDELLDPAGYPLASLAKHAAQGIKPAFGRNLCHPGRSGIALVNARRFHLAQLVNDHVTDRKPGCALAEVIHLEKHVSRSLCAHFAIAGPARAKHFITKPLNFGQLPARASLCAPDIAHTLTGLRPLAPEALKLAIPLHTFTQRALHVANRDFQRPRRCIAPRRERPRLCAKFGLDKVKGLQGVAFKELFGRQVLRLRHIVQDSHRLRLTGQQRTGTVHLRASRRGAPKHGVVSFGELIQTALNCRIGLSPWLGTECGFCLAPEHVSLLPTDLIRRTSDNGFTAGRFHADLEQEATENVPCLRRIIRKLTFYEARQVKRRVVFERQALANALEPVRYTCVDIGNVGVVLEGVPERVLDVGQAPDVRTLKLPAKLLRRLGDPL